MPGRGKRPHIRHRFTFCTILSPFSYCPVLKAILIMYQAYLEEIKEIKEEEAKTKVEEVKKLLETEERADEKKEMLAQKEPREEKEIKLPEAEAKEIICETTFESPTQSEIEQLLKNESKPHAEKKED